MDVAGALLTRRTPLVLALALVALLVSAATAEAATVSRLGNQIVILASLGEANDLEVGGNGVGGAFVRDASGGTLTPVGMNCDQLDPSTVECGMYATVTSVSADLSDRSDSFLIVWPNDDATPPETLVVGDEGDDRLIGGEGDSTLNGGPGNDRLGGEHPCCGDPLEAGDDELHGGDGRDVLIGGEGDDLLDGGPGQSDVFDYAPTLQANSAPAVRLDLAAGQATVGGFVDTLMAGEQVIGSDERDKIKGDGAANVLHGGGARDVVIGRGGRDQLLGGSSSDRIRGGRGRDVLRGQGGNDALAARDGRRDKVDGGSGRADEARVDFDDRVRRVEVVF